VKELGVNIWPYCALSNSASTRTGRKWTLGPWDDLAGNLCGVF